MVLLRGYMLIDLIEADNLPDLDTSFFNLFRKDVSDPFAQVKLGSCVICKTAHINNNLSPKWQESYRIPVCHDVDAIRVMIFDKDHFTCESLGEIKFRPEDVLKGNNIEGWYPLTGSKGRINLKIVYIPKESIDMTFEVPHCYFKMSEGNKLSLYQDAFCPSLPFYESILEPSGEAYVPQCAWIDLYESLCKAEKFIYVSGWSVFVETILIRGCECHEEGEGETFGQLLLRKSEEGLRVLVMVWDEKTSTDVLPGLMGTHDEETRVYFEGSSVEVALVPRKRILEGMGSFFQNQFSQTCYSHHQKTIIMDSPSEDIYRITAFVGGLDVTNGRWDTPEHNLFKTLKDSHASDFYAPCIASNVDSGPRQPWHDIHCKLEGPIAICVLKNFNERWRMQVSEKESRLVSVTEEEYDIESPIEFDNADDSWNAQIFRSISSDSAVLDFDKIHTVPKRKGKSVDDSIHRAYIHHIRRCDRFIYIENQYFVGSAYAWEDDIKIKAHHLIPSEIAHKIIEKINAGEEIMVYIVIPMFPEGNPSSKPVQEILHWQRKTMEMMYKKIASCIEENELDTHPTDYLSFFCLGKREPVSDDLTPLEISGEQLPSQANGRFMIYVHSKMIIVDDDYIIIGSANINQRSMSGTRDSEIAVGAFQPSHTRETCEGEPRGKVHQFRMALWGEHLGSLNDVHTDPGTIDCMREVRERGSQNWNKYISDEVEETEGHLLLYPVDVALDGSVSPLEDYPNFPDFKASIVGNRTFLPDKLTT